MTTVQAFIERHPVLTYFALTFVISWGGILLVVGPGGFPATQDQVDALFPFVMLAWLAGPSAASIVLTALLDGRTGFGDLLTRMTRWRVGARWYTLAFLTAPLLYVAVLLALSLTSPEFLPGILTTSDKAALMLVGIGWGLIGGGFLEELGWTGFAIPRMKLHYGVLSTGLIVGLLWGAYHFSVIFWMDSPSGALPLIIFFVQLFAWLPAYRVLMVWVYDRTESLLVAMLMHASLTASMYIFVTPLALAGVPLLTFLLVWAAVLWAVVAAVAVANGWHLPRQRLQRRVA